MRYKIVYNRDSNLDIATKRTEEQVEKLCKEGWVLQGGISVVALRSKQVYSSDYDDYYTVAQAMVKEN